jgi:hypothetical protein
MASRKINKPFSSVDEKCIVRHNKHTSTGLDDRIEGRVQVTFGSGVQNKYICPMARAAVRASRMAGSAVWLLGLTSTRDDGRCDCQEITKQFQSFRPECGTDHSYDRCGSSRLLKLSTSPSATGSPAVPKTIGVVEAAAFTARIWVSIAPAKITFTLRRTKSAVSAGSLSS